VRSLRPSASPPPPSSRPPEGNLSRLAGGAGALFAGGWMAYALSTLFEIAVARRLGAHGFGAYIVGVSFAWVLGQIAPLGMSWAVVRYVALYRSQGDLERLRGTVWLGVRVTAAGGAILGAAMFLAAPLLATHVLHDPDFTLMLRLLSFAVPLSALTELLLAAVQAHTRVMSTVLVRSVVVPALRLVGALGALAVLGGGPLTVAGGYLAAELVAMLLAVVSVLRVLTFGPVRHPGRQVGQYARPLAAQRILESSTSDFDNLVLSATGSVSLSALFTAALRFTVVANALFKAIGIALAPMVSDIHAADQREHLARLYKAASRWMFAIGVPVFLVQVLFGRWLLTLFGEEFTVAYPALVILATGQLVNSASGVTLDIIRMIGRSGLMLANTVLDVTSLVLFVLILVPRYGLVGAAYAAALQVAISNIVRAVEVWVITRMHPYSLAFAKPLLAGAGAAAAMLATRPLLAPLGELGGMLVLAVTYLGLLAALRLDPDDRAVAAQLLGRLRVKR
jgi:O-antigen/teichoic acid export membrane protein